MEKEETRVPEILKVGTRGARIKIWTFLYLNRPEWFTTQEIAEHLEMPLSTVQIAVKQILVLAPRIRCNDKDKSERGRPEKEYRFQEILK